MSRSQICIHCGCLMHPFESEKGAGNECNGCIDPRDEFEDDDFDSCSDCQWDSCADFGCEIKNGNKTPDIEGWGMPF